MAHLIKCGLILMLLLSAGCATPGADVLRYDQSEREPKPAGFAIEIMDRENIDREFKVIAQITDAIETVYDSEQEIMNNLFSAARQLGGDALIDLETETVDTSYDWISSSDTIYKAKVIVFTD